MYSSRAEGETAPTSQIGTIANELDASPEFRLPAVPSMAASATPFLSVMSRTVAISDPSPRLVAFQALAYEPVDFGHWDAHAALPDAHRSNPARSSEAPQLRPADSQSLACLLDRQHRRGTSEDEGIQRRTGFHWCNSILLVALLPTHGQILSKTEHQSSAVGFNVWISRGKVADLPSRSNAPKEIARPASSPWPPGTPLQTLHSSRHCGKGASYCANCRFMH